MLAIAANRLIVARFQRVSRRDVAADDEGLNKRARFAVVAVVGYLVDDHDDGRAIDH